MTDDELAWSRAVVHHRVRIERAITRYGRVAAGSAAVFAVSLATAIVDARLGLRLPEGVIGPVMVGLFCAPPFALWSVVRWMQKRADLRLFEARRVPAARVVR